MTYAGSDVTLGFALKGNIRLDASTTPCMSASSDTTQEDDINEDELCILTDLHMSSDYNSNSDCQSLGAATLVTFLRREAARIDASLAAEEALQVVEYGCATGGSSLVPLGAIQDSISDRPLRATMNDLPMNDWATLSSTVEPALPEIDFAYAKTSMYNPVSEEATVHLAYSCYAQQWLSGGAPTTLPHGALWANQLARDNEQRKVWEEKSRNDWERFLTLRAKEVLPGGSMVLHIQSSMCDGSLSEGAAVTLQEAKCRMLRDAELTEDEAASIVIPEYMKSPVEILDPLYFGPNARAWSVEQLEYVRMPCPYMEEFGERCKTGCNEPLIVDEIIEKQMRALHAFMDSSLEHCGCKKETIKAFWAHVRAIVDTNPSSLSADWMATFIVLRRLHD